METTKARYKGDCVEVLDHAGNLSKISYGTGYEPWVKTELLKFPAAKRRSGLLSEDQYAWILAHGKLRALVTPLGLTKFVQQYEKATGVFIGLDPERKFRLTVHPNRWWLSIRVALPLEAIDVLPIELGMTLESGKNEVCVACNDVGWELISRGMRL